LVVSRGTDGSNPVPSSGESANFQSVSVMTLVLNRVEPIAVEEAEANINADLKLVDYDKRDDQRTGKSSFCHMLHAETATARQSAGEPKRR
jgi:hypothetical protein